MSCAAPLAPEDARDLRVCEMLDAGYPYSEIAAETGASKHQISTLAAVLRAEDGEDA
jgi:uncharacterized protein YerC